MKKTVFRLRHYIESEAGIDWRAARAGLSAREVEEYYNYKTEKSGVEGSYVIDLLETKDEKIAREAIEKLESVQPYCGRPRRVGAMGRLVFEINALVLEELEYNGEEDEEGELKNIEYFFAPLEGESDDED